MSELIEVALAAVQAGAEIVRAGYQWPQRRTSKDGIDFATETDLASEKAIVEVVRKHYPDHAIFGEEGGLTGDENARFKWLVDPLCGTMNFAAGVPLFSVNLALLDGAEPVLGVMAEPLANEVLVGERDKGAYVAGTQERLMPSPASRLLVLDVGNVADKVSPAFLEGPVVRALASKRFRIRQMGSALPAGYIARGRLAGGIFLTAEAVHHAAGALICREAGCVVTDLDGKEWTPESADCVIAADASTYEEIRGLIDGTRSTR